MYDYIIEKPELNEETLAHYGIKGMKWKKRLKGKYYSTKSKVAEAKGKIKSKFGKNGLAYNMDIAYENGTDRPGGNANRQKMRGYPTSGSEHDRRNAGIEKYSRNPRTSNVEAGIEAGRERVKKKKK